MTDDFSSSNPIFIVGLARAGTTMLLNAIYSTELFRSLNYRDMPFVLMPSLWATLSKPFFRYQDARERVHQDRILVNFDSPEAFEEIFWKHVCGADYFVSDGLKYHAPNNETIDRFRRFVFHVLNSSENPAKKRYLSKNNNNLLRLPAIRTAFPNAAILIPFRDPLQHALSLHKQHHLFLQQQEADPFSLEYMNFLGHHEFGKNHKPFLCNRDKSRQNPYLPETLEYWLFYWADVYEFTLEQAPAGSLFFSYERFCDNPFDTLKSVFNLVGIDELHLQRSTENIKAGAHPKKNVPDSLLKKASAIYKILDTKSLSKN